MGYRWKGLLACLLGLAFCLAAAAGYRELHENTVRDSYAPKLEAAVREKDPLAGINEDFTVNGNFKSHLPVVVLEMEEEPPISTRQNPEDGRFIPIEGVEPYVDGTVYLYASGEGNNSLGDDPCVVSRMRIKRRGNSSMLYEKAQYMVKLVSESGQYRDLDILGMGEEHEWILNGSMADKSMLRNYLVYSIASEIMPYTPDNKYCEVILGVDGRYTYQGVFLLGESIRQGEDRVNISKYKTGDVFNSYLVRRDRYDEEGLMLNTYAREHGLAAEWFGLLYPSDDEVSEDAVAYVEDDLSRLEKVLYSNDLLEFSTYENLIDVDSFVNYFLLNEFFGSYDSGNFSTYFFKERGGKLTMGPAWDYDGTIDNYKHEPLDTDALAFQTKPWFEQLCRDNTFITKLEKRYFELRRSTFSEEHIIGKIEEITAHLGGAREREWYRWGHIYTQDTEYNLENYKLKDGTVLVREAKTYEDELYRMKTALRKHGDEIPGQLSALHKSAEFTTGIMNRHEVWLFLVACVFLIPLYYIARR